MQAMRNNSNNAKLAETGTYSFGTNQDVTASTLFNSETGYGFQDETYPQEAPGWVNNVYYPRVKQVEAGASFVSGEEDYLEIKSRIWTETESTGYGVFTYEETSSLAFELENGDYTVAVTLINPTDSDLTIGLKAEDIAKVSNLTLRAGERVVRSFTACLIDGELNLKFLETSTAATVTEKEQALLKSVYVVSVELTAQGTPAPGEKPTIFIASDSTVQTYDANLYPQEGWGQELYSFFGVYQDDYTSITANYGQAHTYITENAVIENRAIGGRSSKSFIEEGKLDDLLEDIVPGDYLFVQWGHNDATYSRPNRYVAPADFETYLQYYIQGAKQRGAICVLVTPVARYSYVEGSEYENGFTFVSNFEEYRQVMLKISREQDVPLLDLTMGSIQLCNSFGIEGAKSLFLMLSPGEYPSFPDGVNDSTHIQFYGAYKFAQVLAKQLLENPDLAELASLVELTVPSEVPEVPAGLTTSVIGASSVGLTWQLAKDAELYYIYRAVVEEGMSAEEVVFDENSIKYSVTPNTQYTDSGCREATTYVYALRAFNEFGISDYSQKIIVTTKSSAYRFDFGVSTSPNVMEGWTEVTELTMYNAQNGYGWLTSPGNGRNRSGNGSAYSSPMTDDFCLGQGEFALDLPRNGDYELQIYAGDLLPGTSTIKASYWAEGNSIGTISARQSIGTLAATARVIDGQLNVEVGGTNPYINGMEITPILYAPSGLSYSEITITETQASFLISFVGVEEAFSYNVYRKGETDKTFAVNKTFTAEELVNNELDARSLTATLGETYEYYITAVTAAGMESAPSNTIVFVAIDPDVEVPAAPDTITAETVEKQNITITWNAVDTAIYYNIYRSAKAEGEKGFKEYIKIGTSIVNRYTDDSEDLTPNIPYYYKVQAVNAGGQGLLSDAFQTPITYKLNPQPAETLTDRGVIAVNLAGQNGGEINVSAVDKDGNMYESGVFISWRSFGADDADTTFTVYRSGVVAAEGLTVTNMVDEAGLPSDTYKVVGSNDEALGLEAIEVPVWKDKYLEIDLCKPKSQTMPDGSTAFYTANDMSVGDLDGDGKYELIVKWAPSNGQDNSKGGYTGTTIIDAYKIDPNTGSAALLWRVDLGVNIRSGAHYTQFQVWDYDGDGCAELAVKTADGTTIYISEDGTDQALTETGHVGAANASALPVGVTGNQHDYRNSSGYILEGPEYFTIFDGKTGTIIDTVDYIPERGNVSAWGDAYGNRVDRFLSGTAYLDGEKPYAVFCRGYYTRTCLTAYYLADTDGDGKGDTIKVYWRFDTNDLLDEYDPEEIEGQGNHSLCINDVDGDGKDEIIYGSLVVDHDGSVLYTTGLGHGDALHVSDFVDWNDGLEVMDVHEHENIPYHVELHDAETGKILMGYNTGTDTGRGIAADIDPTSPGAEFWASAGPGGGDNEWNSKDGGVFTTESTLDNLVRLSPTSPAANFAVYWDGDRLKEVLDHEFEEKINYLPEAVTLTKWNYEKQEEEFLFRSTEVWSNNGTKGNPCLAADLFGDWRDEIIVRLAGNGKTESENDNKIRIYTTTIDTDYVVPCLMENRAYREAIAWQNVAYNQPASLDYSLSKGLITAQLQVGEVTNTSVEIIFTRASDGIYGHEVQGYEVYRAGDSGVYELVTTIAVGDLVSHADEADSCVYVDQTVSSNTVYTYKIAAVVDGKTSFKSMPISTQTLITVTSVPEIILDDIIQDTVLSEGETIADLLPQTVSVIDENDEYHQAAVTWDVSQADLSEPGTYTVTAHVAGWETPLPVNLTIIPNTITGYDAAAVSVILGAEVQLPEVIAVHFLNGTTRNIPVSWDTAGLDVNTLGDYVIKGSLSGYDYEVEITVSVKENYIISVEEVGDIEVEVGTAFDVALLPQTVIASYADGTVKEVPVSWNESYWDSGSIGAFLLQGDVEEMIGIARLTVSVVGREIWKFDFGVSAAQAAEGWTAITVNGKGGTATADALEISYSQQRGYGFLGDGTEVIEGRDENYVYDGGDLPQLVYRDFVLPDLKSFAADVPEGIYEVDIVSGSNYSSSVVVSVQGMSNYRVSNGAGQYNIGTVRDVVVSDGQLRLDFPTNNTSRLCAVVIRQVMSMEVKQFIPGNGDASIADELDQ